MAHYRKIMVDGTEYEWVVGRSDRLTVKGLGTVLWEDMGFDGETYYDEWNKVMRPIITPHDVENYIRMELLKAKLSRDIIRHRCKKK